MTCGNPIPLLISNSVLYTNLVFLIIFGIHSGKVWRELLENVICDFFFLVSQGLYLTRGSAFYPYPRPDPLFLTSLWKGFGMSAYVHVRGRPGAVSFLRVSHISFRGN